VLSAIYEQDFLPRSFGGRPKLSDHHALATLNEVIAGGMISWVLEADLRTRAAMRSPRQSTIRPPAAAPPPSRGQALDHPVLQCAKCALDAPLRVTPPLGEFLALIEESGLRETRRWREQDSNFQFLAARSSNRHGRRDCCIENGSGSVGEPKVRIHLSPAGSLLRTSASKIRRLVSVVGRA
jgi:hypothetical protein